jgi:hypothetical protein
MRKRIVVIRSGTDSCYLKTAFSKACLLDEQMAGLIAFLPSPP